MFELSLALILGTIGVIAAAITVFLAVLMRRVVKTNEVHIVQRKKVAVSYGKDQAAGNVYYHWPAWVPGLGVGVSRFPVSVFNIDLKDYEAYDRDRVPFLVDVVAFFRIDDSNTAAQRVATYQELQVQLKSIVQGAVRTILASEDIDSIMIHRSLFGEKFTSEVSEQLKSWGVIPVKNMELMDIRDSHGSSVIESIQAKRISEIEKDSRVVVAENTRAAQTAEIAAARDVNLQKQEAEQKVGERTAEKERVVGIANQKQKQEVAVEVKETRTRELAVAEVEEVRKAEIAKGVAVVQAEQDQRTLIINTEAKAKAAVVQADGQKKQAIVTAEGQKEQTILVADGKLEAERRNAQGIEAVGTATAEAERAKGLALVAPQITLAKEIGENKPYQDYLIQIRVVEKDEAIGVANAGALEKADIKVLANNGTVADGISGVGDIFSAKGGAGLGQALEAFVQTPTGQALLAKLTGGSL